MSAFALQSAEARADFIHQLAIPGGIPAYIVEKDFWVCWLLGRIFVGPKLGSDCVFKGGTSLSKVFGVIDRFSEDIDLGISPVSLGWQEADLDNAPSPSQRRKRMLKLEADCTKAVKTSFLPELVAVVRDVYMLLWQQGQREQGQYPKRRCRLVRNATTHQLHY